MAQVNVEEQVQFSSNDLKVIEGRLERIFAIPDFEDLSKSKSLLAPIPNHESYQEKTRQTRMSRKSDLPDFLTPCYESPLLTPEQELHLFRQYNYRKFLASKWLMWNRIDKAQSELEKADLNRQMITSANLRLAVNGVRRYRNTQHYADLVSEGFAIIHHAVDHFDYRRNFKFSTYAHYAIANSTGRLAKELFVHDSRNSGILANVAPFYASDDQEQEESFNNNQNKLILENLMKVLDDRERKVLIGRFFEEKTLEKIGQELGLTKERIRQIEGFATNKLSLAAARKGLTSEKIWG